ncbi:MAG: DUF3467 domain-containing protein [Bacteroidota bacterium]
MAKKPITEEDENPGNQLNIEISEDMAEGVYSNLAMIAHSNSEFVFDFIRMMPGVPKAKVKSRVVMTPEHAVRFLSALKENIERYEENFGDIKMPKDGIGGLPPFTFGGNMGQA